MGRLIYSMSVSLDGFAAGPDGLLDWGLVDPPLDSPIRTRLLETRVFGSGVILLRYETLS